MSWLTKERANSALHLVSALFWATTIFFVRWVSLLPFVSRVQVRLGLVIGTTAFALDASAAILQARKPPSGYILSIALHFLFVQAVVILGTFEYIENGSHSFLHWFTENNWIFVSILALARVIAGVALLPATDGKS